ncbi:MAG: hypothetical protein WCJ29_01545 [bacterium]
MEPNEHTGFSDVKDSQREPTVARAPDIDKPHAEEPAELKHRLASMKREDFAEYLIHHGKEFGEMVQIPRFGSDVNQVYGVITRRPEFRGLSEKEIDKAVKPLEDEVSGPSQVFGMPQVIRSIRIQEETKNRENVVYEFSGAFLSWKFRNGSTEDVAHKKAWITLPDPLHEITPQLIGNVIEAIVASGFSGNLKILNRTKAIVRRYENITIHADNDEELDKAQKAAVHALLLDGVMPQGVARGQDSVEMSDNQLLAGKICKALTPNGKITWWF